MSGLSDKACAMSCISDTAVKQVHSGEGPLLRLRPHHLLCIQKFTGRGYDEAFAAHMTEVTELLKHHPQTRIVLSAGCDELCGACPNMQHSLCSSHKKVERIDKAVIDGCRFLPAEEGPWEYLSGIARDRILTTELFGEVCGDCQWMELCRNTKKGIIDDD